MNRRRRAALQWTLWGQILACAALLAALSWRRWSEPMIDFGVQLYLPWRISLGEHLYTDYIHPYGPWSVYYHAALFRLFGVSLTVITVSNLVWLGGILTALYVILRRCFGILPAGVAVLFALPTFAFSHLTGIGNYNFLGPYSHEVVHGLFFLCLLLLLALTGDSPTKPWRGGIVGVLLGLICLTKPEIVLAAVGAITVTAVRLSRRRDPIVLRWIVAVVGACALILAVTWGLLCLQVGPKAAAMVAFSGVLGPFFYSSYATGPNTLRFMGLDQPWANAWLLARYGLAAAAVLGILLAAARLVPRLPRVGQWLAIGASGGAALFLCTATTNHYPLAAPLLLAIAGSGVVLRMIQARRAGQGVSSRYWRQLALLAVAELLMVRMALAPKVEHYGFYQYMFAALWICGFYAGEWPRLAGSLPGARLLAVFVLSWHVAFGLMATRVSALFYKAKDVAIASGGDRMYGYIPEVSTKHQVFEETRAFLAARVRRESSVLVLPEGIMMNYLLRANHPLRITNALAPTLRLLDDNLETALARRPPDYVVLMSRPGSDDSYAPFGADDTSGREALEWIATHYALIHRTGKNPLTDRGPDDFGAFILQRRELQIAPARDNERHVGAGKR